MALAQEDIEYIKTHIPQWLAEQSLGSPPAVYEVELRERTIRVEEELKHQRELMLQGFKQVEKRFEQTDKRFEQIDKRFEENRIEMDKRFEQVDKRFEESRVEIDKRFEQVDKRFEENRTEIDKRFEEMLIRTDKIAARHDRMQWIIFLTMLGYFFKEQITPLLGG